MYIYKIVVTYQDGGQKTEWICPNSEDTIASCAKRVELYIDELEADTTVKHVKSTRRTMPGI